MSNDVDKEIIEEFQIESRNLIDQLMNTLENCEGDFSQVLRLESYGQTVDRIMGGARSVSGQIAGGSQLIQQLGDYAAVCKAVGYKASQISGNLEFYNICVAFLLDSTAVRSELVDGISGRPEAELKDFISATFIERLKWVSNQFGEGVRASVDINKGLDQKMSQEQIDSLIQKLGLG